MEAAYYEPYDTDSVRCLLCPNYCVIANGKKGACRVRTNRDGKLEASAYGQVVSLAIDPVEKKPLYHFYPSNQILSTGANGCNFRCGFCQNSEISQNSSPTRYVSPEDLAQLASQNGSIGVAYTYTEPFIWFEYIRDAGRLVHDRGLVNVLVTNGYVNEEPLRELLPVVDAMNIDVKSMRPEFYNKVCGGKLEDVLRTVEIASQQCHVEITNLVITNYNDTEEDFLKLADWIYSIDPLIPLHISRYSPRYKFNEPPTPVETLVKAYETAKLKLKYVYLGNIVLTGTGDTLCPSCGNLLVKRTNYSVSAVGIRGGVCSSCGSVSDFVGMD
ncbi:MAG: AmmeMemoRadiSam system radical SAM enzyme [Candidatus Latescibacteria bacterium]|nr:AmmeMemoRadiSam system radical SAM enzyme [Candidatus Latescibacterota bacterium]